MSHTAPVVTVRPEPMEGPAASLLTQRLRDEVDHLYPGEQVGGTLDPAEAAPPQGIFLVAYLDGRPAGCGGLHRLDQDVAEVRRMYVEPWARAHGLARRLLAGLEAKARSMGCSSVRLGTGTQQPAAIRLYESSGYRRVPAYGPYAGISVSVCFEKTLLDECRPEHDHQPGDEEVGPVPGAHR